MQTKTTVRQVKSKLKGTEYCSLNHFSCVLPLLSRKLGRFPPAMFSPSPFLLWVSPDSQGYSHSPLHCLCFHISIIIVEPHFSSESPSSGLLFPICLRSQRSKTSALSISVLSFNFHNAKRDEIFGG